MGNIFINRIKIRITEYVCSQLPIFLQQYNLISREEFNTYSGMVGECAVISDFKNNFYLRQALIFKPAVLGCLANQIISLREEINNAG